MQTKTDIRYQENENGNLLFPIPAALLDLVAKMVVEAAVEDMDGNLYLDETKACIDLEAVENLMKQFIPVGNTEKDRYDFGALVAETASSAISVWTDPSPYFRPLHQHYLRYAKNNPEANLSLHHFMLLLVQYPELFHVCFAIKDEVNPCTKEQIAVDVFESLGSDADLITSREIYAALETFASMGLLQYNDGKYSLSFVEADPVELAYAHKVIVKYVGGDDLAENCSSNVLKPFIL